MHQFFTKLAYYRVKFLKINYLTSYRHLFLSIPAPIVLQKNTADFHPPMGHVKQGHS